MNDNWHIASVSFGKDSLAMVLMLIEKGFPLDEVVFYDTGMEFQAIYDIRDELLPILKEHNIKYHEIVPGIPFEYKMFDKPVKERKGGTHNGYSWCGGRCRWGTTDKLIALDKYAESKNAIVYVGIAADEIKRLNKPRKPYKIYPLADWKMTEQDCLDLCYQYGFFWTEGVSGMELYELLDRVSCWCCANKNLKELKNIYMYLPDYWEKLKQLQLKTARPMKGYHKGNPVGVLELEKRFKAELDSAETTKGEKQDD